MIDDLRSLRPNLKSRARKHRLDDMGSQPPLTPQRAFFECHNKWIEEVIVFPVHLTSSARIGAGGLSKTSTTVIILYHGRVKQRSGDNRVLIPCNRSLASLHFLRRPSETIGVGIRDPEDLSPLTVLILKGNPCGP